MLMIVISRKGACFVVERFLVDGEGLSSYLQLRARFLLPSLFHPCTLLRLSLSLASRFLSSQLIRVALPAVFSGA